MPAPEWWLSVFITTMGAGSVGGGAIMIWLLGLQLWHIVNGTPWNGTAHLQRAMQGSSSVAPLPTLQPRRAPVTLAHLIALRNTLDLNNTFDAAIFSAATVAFWCQCQLGEVCVDSLFDPTIHASCATQQKMGWTLSNIRFHYFWAFSMKTSPHGEEIRWTDSCCSCSTEWAFQNHWTVNLHVPATKHLFAFKMDTGNYAPMCRSWFLDRCNEVWSGKGLSMLSGHSFRIGGTTHLLLLGINPFIVMVQGCWRSSAFLDYWRLCEEIITTFVGFSLMSQTSLLNPL